MTQVRPDRGRVPLGVEALEGRANPATSGVPWPDPAHLTLSFVPDGTSVGGVPSTLGHALDAVAPRAVWQGEIVRAFRAWADHAGIALRVRDHGGQPLGTPGAVEGDSRFGDIRVAGRPLPPGTLATNAGFQWSGTTWSGDVVVNTSYHFAAAGRGDGYDLYSLMLNEAGNVFGVVDTRTDPASAVYYRYAGRRDGPSAGDVADIQSLYGPPAAQGDPALPGHVFTGSVAGGATAFTVQAPAGGAGKLNVIAWAADADRSAPAVEVLAGPAPGTPCPVRVLANDGGTYSVELDGVTPGATYTLRVSPHAAPGRRPAGRFTLAAGFNAQPATGGSDPLAAGTLAPADGAAVRAFAADRNQLYEFAVSATGGQVRVDVIDAGGRTVASVLSDPGRPTATAHAYLPAGSYSVRVTVVARSGRAAVGYAVGSRVASDPIGPAYTDEPPAGPARPQTPPKPPATPPKPPYGRRSPGRG
jgi:hypothetical protein